MGDKFIELSVRVERELEIHDRIYIRLEQDDDRQDPLGVLYINGVPYHFFETDIQKLYPNDIEGFKVDLDDDYNPRGDFDGKVYLLAPYNK